VTVTAAVLTSITITPSNPSIANGSTLQLTATGTFSDGSTQNLTTQVSWTSSSDTMATVNNTNSLGLVTATGVGSATITATYAGVSGTTTVTVTAAVLTSITITPSNPSIANGATIQLTAMGTYSDGSTQDLTTQVSWTSSSDTMATVNNTISPGLVTATGVGSATITATLSGVSGATTVTIPSTCNTGDGTTVAAYNAIPFEGVNCSPAAWSFEGDATSEFGDEVGLAAGTGRNLVSLNVLFSSLACSDSGHWYDGTCVTTPGTTFDWPITANIYAVNDCSGTPCPGTLLATVTQTQTIPYRPSAAGIGGQCTNPAKWFNPSNITSADGCQNALAVVLPFNFTTGITIPDQVIWTVAFNTTDYGAAPIGDGAACVSSAPGCPYDNLNVGATSYPNAPYAGTDIDPNGVFFNSTFSGFYCDNGMGGIGLLRLDTPCWTGYTPLGEVITK
jgi:hypothetical protein